MFLDHATNGAVYLDDPELLEAYRAFFFPQTYAKVRSILDELALPAPARVLDLGSAMGGAAFAAFDAFAAAGAGPGPKLDLVDFSAAALADARRLAAAVDARCMTRQFSLAQGLPPITEKYDLVIAANALSELPFEDRVNRCQAIFSTALTQGGRVILIEPADRVHARDLQTLRDRLLALGHVPTAPCPHAEPCPASTRERDFCHQARSVALPKWHAELQAAVGISDERMRFSYLAYGPRLTHEEDLVRIISHPIKDKGRMRFLGCAAAGLVEIQRQEKHRSEANAAFDSLGRGALVRMKGDKRIKIEADTRIDVVSEADRDEAARLDE